MRFVPERRLTKQMSFSRSGIAEAAHEPALVNAACAGEERAFGVLIERYQPGLEEFCGLMLGDLEQAEQAMREAVLTAWRERGLAPASSSVRMWLYRIALRVCLEALNTLR